MAHSRVKRPSSEGLTTTFVGARVCAFLRDLHPERTLDQVTADLAGWDVSRDTVRNMLERETAPGAILWLALIEAYGPDFLAAAHPRQLGWLQEAQRRQRRAEYEAARAALDAAYEDCQ